MAVFIKRRVPGDFLKIRNHRGPRMNSFDKFDNSDFALCRTPQSQTFRFLANLTNVITLHKHNTCLNVDRFHVFVPVKAIRDMQSLPFWFCGVLIDSAVSCPSKESDSTISCPLGSQAQQFPAHWGVRLSNFLPTEESDSVISCPLGSQTP